MRFSGLERLIELLLGPQHFVAYAACLMVEGKRPAMSP